MKKTIEVNDLANSDSSDGDISDSTDDEQSSEFNSFESETDRSEGESDDGSDDGSDDRSVYESDNDSEDESTDESDDGSDDESEHKKAAVKKTKKQQQNDRVLEMYKKAPTKQDLDSWRFPRRVLPLLASNNQELIDKHLNINIFKQMINFKEPKSRARTLTSRGHRFRVKYRARRPTRGEKTLTRTMGAIFKFYIKNVCTKRDGSVNGDQNVTHATRTKIISLILDYYRVCGKSGFLICNLIKCRLWGVLALIHSISPITGSDITMKSLDRLTVDMMQKKGIDLSDDHQIVMKFGTPEFQLRYLQTHELYQDSYIKINELEQFKGDIVYKYLCDNNMIDLSSKMISLYHEKCMLSLLIFLASNDLIKIKSSDINKIFKKKITKRKVVKYKTTRYRRWRSRFSYKKKSYNKDATGKDFKSNIVDYLKLVTNKGGIVPIANCVKYSFMANKLYNEFIDVIDFLYAKPGSRHFSLDKKEKYNLFEAVVEIDDIDRFHKLINNKVIDIQDLHRDKEYITRGLNNIAEKIVRYMVDVLKVKYIDFSASRLWGWSFRRMQNDKFIKCLRLMKSLNMNVPDTLLSTVLSRKKQSDVVDVLINEFGMKITKSHIKYLKYYSVSSFSKYTKDLVFNKKTLIRSLIGTKTKRNYWRNSQHDGARRNLALHLISKLPQKTKIKEARKYCTHALLHGNQTLCSLLMKRYGVEVDMKQIKNAINNNTINTDGVGLLQTLVTSENKNADIKKIREVFTDDDLINLLKNHSDNYGYYGYRVSKNKKSAASVKIKIEHIVRDLKIQCTPEKLEEFVTEITNNRRRWNGDSGIDSENQSILASIIKGMNAYVKVDSDVDTMKKIVNILWTADAIQTIKKLQTKKHDCISLITPKMFYTKMLDILYTGRRLDDLIKLVDGQMDRFASPYVYKMLQLGMRASRHNHDIWSRSQLSKKVLQCITAKAKHILQEDYYELRSQCDHITWFVTHKKVKIVQKYDPTPDEIPDELDFYTNIIQQPNRRNYDDSDADSVAEALNENNEINNAIEAAINEVNIDDDSGEDSGEDSDAVSLDGVENAPVIRKRVAKRAVKKIVYKKINQN